MQQQSRDFSLREWVGANTSREEAGEPLQADIVRGLWTCCKHIVRTSTLEPYRCSMSDSSVPNAPVQDPEHPGCVHAEHSQLEEKCERCASWVPRGKWEVEACVAHESEAKWFRYHGVAWQCCGDASLKFTARLPTRTFVSPREAHQ